MEDEEGRGSSLQLLQGEGVAGKHAAQPLDDARREREVEEAHHEAALMEGQGCVEPVEAPTFPLRNPQHPSSHRAQAAANLE